MSTELYACTKCGLTFPLSGFYIRRKGPYTGQLRQPCKKCDYSSQIVYRQTPQGKASMVKRNRSEAAKQATARYIKSERFRIARAEYRKGDEGRARRARWRQSEKARMNERRRLQRYYGSKKGKEAAIKYNAQRRMLIARRSDLTSEQWQSILQNFLHCCAYCGRSNLVLERDHILPLSKGGQHTARNIVPACRSCNARKHNVVPFGLSSI